MLATRPATRHRAARPDLLPGLRFFPVGNYLILYRESTEGVDLIRILHGARDYGRRDF
jgi:toxin ParE1/3/4